MDAEATIETLMARLAQLEEQVAANNYQSLDPNVKIRHPGSDFQPSPEALAIYPDQGEDFFRSKLDDADRRKFLFDCPKNNLRQYEPPTLNRVPSMGENARKTDQLLRDIQYRLSGLTRPIDWYIYQSAHANWDIDQFRAYSRSLACNMGALLADVASYITDLRVAGLLAGVDGHQRPPENPLVPNEELLEQLRLSKSLQEVTQTAKKSGQHKRKGARPQRRFQGAPATPTQPSLGGPVSPLRGSDRQQGEPLGFQQRNPQKQRHH